MSKILIALILSLPILANAERYIVGVDTTRPALMTIQGQSYLNGKIKIVDGSNLESLMKNPAVKYIEKDRTFKVFGQMSQSSAGEAWGVEKVKAAKMWAQGFNGEGVKVAVIDTGVDGSHPELDGRVMPGFNAIDGTENAMDDQGHGTHCAGTIAGRTVGVAPKALIVPVKFLDKNGSGTLSNAIKAVDWVAKQQDIQIVSNSWGGGGKSQALEDAFKALTESGKWVTAAAGNESRDNDVRDSIPANYAKTNDKVIAVAASDKNDKQAYFSNYGLKSVLIAAPGTQILSSVPGGKYDSWDGTSMATPHVSGMMAILLQAGKTELKAALIENSVQAQVKTITGARIEFK